MMQSRDFVLDPLRQGTHDDEGAAAEVCELLRVGVMALEPVGDALQEPITGVPSEGVVDDAQVLDVEPGPLEPRQALSAALEQAAQALAEQRALGESGQRLEVR